jgi:hypothetical protein
VLRGIQKRLGTPRFRHFPPTEIGFGVLNERAGRLGGRPRKPTQAETRSAALEELVPAATKSLAAHLGDGEATSWRAALRVSSCPTASRRRPWRSTPRRSTRS